MAGIMDSGIGWPALMLSVSLELPIQLEDGGPEPLSGHFWGHPDEAVELRCLAWGLLVACSDDLELVEAAVDGGLIRSFSPVEELLLTTSFPSTLPFANPLEMGSHYCCMSWVSAFGL